MRANYAQCEQTLCPGEQKRAQQGGRGAPKPDGGSRIHSYTSAYSTMHLAESIQCH